jgi:hypothetical protein
MPAAVQQRTGLVAVARAIYTYYKDTYHTGHALSGLNVLQYGSIGALVGLVARLEHAGDARCLVISH